MSLNPLARGSPSAGESLKRNVEHEDSNLSKKARNESDSEDSNQEGDTSIKWSAYTIHRLKLKKIESTCPSRVEETPHQKVERLLDRVILLQNETSSHFTFSPLPPLDEKKLADIQNAGFRIKGFYRSLNTTSSFAKFFFPQAPQPDKKRSEYLIFFYRLKRKNPEEEKWIYDIFAVATGHSWMAISAFRDHDFSFRLAKKIAKPALYEMLTRPLFGKKISSSQRWEEFQYGNPISSYSKWTYNFKTEINSEVIPKTLFPAQTEHQEFRLAVGQGSIRLEQGISLVDIPRWLAHFAEVLRDKKSLDNIGNELGAQFFAFLDFLQPVDQALAHSLPFVIKREIWQAMHRPGHTTSLRCIPALMNDYCRADKVALKGKDIPKQMRGSFTWSAPQPVALMIRQLCEVPCIKELLNRSVHKDRPPKEFFDLIDTIYLVHSSGSAKPHKVQWIASLDGEVIEKESGQHYFRIAGRWFTLSMDVLFHVHKDFQDLLKSVILKASHQAALPKPWTGRESDSEGRVDVEGIYNNSYLDQAGFLVGDKACPYGIELFDLLHFTETDLYLYQVKEEFGYKTRDASSQIVNAAKFVAQAITANDPEVYSLFLQQQKSYCSQGYERLVLLAGGQDKALTWLENLFKKYNRENIHFVYAFANKISSGRKLEDELQLKKQISAKDLQGVLEGVQDSDLVDSLKEQGFLDRKGFVTPSLLTCSSKKFCAEFKHPAIETQKAKKKLYDKLNEIVMSEYGSTIARMSLLDASKKVRKLGFSFHICQIANQAPPTPEEDASQSSFVIVDALEKELSPKFIAGDTILTPDGNYLLLPTKHDSGSLLHALLGQKTEREIVYAPPENESARITFADLLKTWLESKKENKDLLERKIVELLKSSPQQPFTDASRKYLNKHLQKKEIKIKDVLKSLENLQKKCAEADTALQEASIQWIKKSKNSLFPAKFLQTVFGLSVPIPEAVKRIQQLLAGPKEEVLNFVLSLDPQIQKFPSGIQQEPQVSKDLKAAQKTKEDASQKLAEQQQEYDKVDIILQYLSCLKDPFYPFLMLEVELAALIYEQQVTVYYPEETEIKKQVFNPTAPLVKTLFWRGKKDKIPSYFACEKTVGNVQPFPLSEPSPLFSVPSTPQKKAPLLIDLSGSPEKIKVGIEAYEPLETMGHGACLLHAILGEIKNGSVCWQENDEQARKKYAEDFSGKMAMQPELLIPYLKSLIQDIPNGAEFQLNRTVWALQPFYQAQLAPLHARRKELIEKNKPFSNHLIEVLAGLCESLAPTDKGIELLFTAVGSLPDSKEIWKKRCHEIRSNIIAYFKASMEIPDALTTALSDVEKVESELKKIDDQFLTLASQEALWKTYANVICSSAYWFTESDARIIAYLYNKKVEIYARYNSSYGPACDPLNEEAAESVVVFFQRTEGNRGYHYSQCSKS